MTFRCLIFDADNTLYQTKSIARKADMAAMQILAKEAKKSPKALYAEFLTIVEKMKTSRDPKKRSRMYSYGKLAQRYGIKTVYKAYNTFFRAVVKHIKLVPGAMKFLREASRHYKLCIVTEDEAFLAVRKLQKHGMNRYINVLITSTDAGVMKPNRRYYTLLQKKAKCKLSECVVIGDDYKRDLALPQKQGAFTISFGKQHRLANYSVRNYRELEQFLFPEHNT